MIYKIFNAEDYDEMLDVFGKPLPCEKCVVKPMCFSWEKEDSIIFITLNNPCKKAKNWLRGFMDLDCEFSWRRSKEEEKLAVQKLGILKMI